MGERESGQWSVERVQIRRWRRRFLMMERAHVRVRVEAREAEGSGTMEGVLMERPHEVTVLDEPLTVSATKRVHVVLGL